MLLQLFQVLICKIFIWSYPQLSFGITKHYYFENLKKQADDVHFIGVQSHPITYGKIGLSLDT